MCVPRAGPAVRRPNVLFARVVLRGVCLRREPRFAYLAM